MSHPPPPLGDSHNFGRRVVRRGDRIEKPRTVGWEWLVLSKSSPLRRLLDERCAADPLGPGAFSFLPDLAFFPPPAPGATHGVVQAVALAPLPPTAPATLAPVVGRSLALWSWLGVGDLHWENLVLGIDSRGSIVFSPIDVELILADFALPTETRLLPDVDPDYAAFHRHAAGIRRALPVLGKPVPAPVVVAVASAYHATLGFLERHAAAISAVFAALPGLHETPIRVTLRGTSDYVRARSAPIWPPLLDEESEQLARGDIPYFFRCYGRPGIHWFTDPELSHTAHLPLEGDVPQLEPLLPVERGMRSPSRTRLREEGLFAVLAALDHRALAATHTEGDLTVNFGRRALTVTLPGGETLETRRDLGAHVGSVYLPCRCGEVASVFVPPVHKCKYDTHWTGA